MAKYFSQIYYESFAKEVKETNRYIHSSHSEQFLSEFRDYIYSKRLIIKKNTIFYRAQIGCDFYDAKLSGVSAKEKLPKAYGEARLRPLRDSAREGRLNPKGISYMYLANTKKTAISETRPWKFDIVSVGVFENKNELKIVTFDPLKNPNNEKFWRDKIDFDEYESQMLSHAFSRPVNNTEKSCDYVPTQILSEVIKNEGFDGIEYQSVLSSGINYVIFDQDKMKFTNSTFEIVKSINYEIYE
jgi:hypothetical protein